MIKRMTMLARKSGMAQSDFRAYWAGPHAQLALGMPGIGKYIHNRIDKLLWSSQHTAAWQPDGIVELYFTDANAMQAAQASAIGQHYIPDDELNFLRGWTLCVVEENGVPPPLSQTKILIPFLAHSNAHEALKQALDDTPAALAIPWVLSWTQSTAKRPRLWAEPCPPAGFLTVWLPSVSAAHAALDESTPLRTFLATHTQHAEAYLVDELVIQ